MKFGDLRTILRYVPQFQGQIFVFVIDGEVIDSGNFSSILVDLALLRSLGVKVVLVFDVGPQMAKLATDQGAALSSLAGRGPTDDFTLDALEDTVSRMSTKLTKKFAEVGIRTAAANVLTVHVAGIRQGTEQLRSGRVDGVDAEALTGMLEQGLLPIVSPLGFCADGKSLALDPDIVAGEIGVALGAGKVIFVTAFEKCPVSDSGARQFSVPEIREFLDEPPPEVPPEVCQRLERGIRSCEEGVPRVHFLPGMNPEALLGELFSNEGVGTMIYSDVYRFVRKAKVTDIERIVSMTRRAVEDEQLLSRSLERVRDRLDDFRVLEVDGNLVGCVALRFYPDDCCAEIGSLFVGRNHVGQGYGQVLISRLVEEAKSAGAATVFAFTTQAADFFEQKCGFTLTEVFDAVPAERVEVHRASGRNSKLFVKVLID